MERSWEAAMCLVDQASWTHGLLRVEEREREEVIQSGVIAQAESSRLRPPRISRVKGWGSRA